MSNHKRNNVIFVYLLAPIIVGIVLAFFAPVLSGYLKPYIEDLRGKKIVIIKRKWLEPAKPFSPGQWQRTKMFHVKSDSEEAIDSMHLDLVVDERFNFEYKTDSVKPRGAGGFVHKGNVPNKSVYFYAIKFKNPSEFGFSIILTGNRRIPDGAITLYSNAHKQNFTLVETPTTDWLLIVAAFFIVMLLGAMVCFGVKFINKLS